jgi:hypothetical protein
LCCLCLSVGHDGAVVAMQNEPVEVYVARDYSAGIEPTTFARGIPRELEERVSEHDYLAFVDAVNDLYREGERTGWNTVFESVAGCLTCYSLFLFYDSTYKRAMHKLERLVKSQNALVFLPRGVRVRNPLFNGNLHLEFLVYPKAQKQ